MSGCENFVTLGRVSDAPGGFSPPGTICGDFFFGKLSPPRGARAQLDSALGSSDFERKKSLVGSFVELKDIFKAPPGERQVGILVHFTRN